MAENRTAQSNRPAILGGEPVFPNGPPEWPLDDPRVAEALKVAFADRSWGKYHGENCNRLCGRLRSYFSCNDVVLCSSGTAAVELALRGLKVGPGDEVILAAYDFKGNFQNVLTVGATPVLVDVEPQNWNIGLSSINKGITEKTKAVIISHLHGGIVPVPNAVHAAREREIPVIEDVCQMPGSSFNGRQLGTWGDIGVLSFGGSKLLTAGRGGALFTNDADVVQRIKLYTNRGNEAYPLSELQAAVLLPQLEQLDERNRRRMASAAYLTRQLAKFDGLSLFQNADTDAEPGYYKIGLQYSPAAFDGLSRDDFSAAMRAEGVALDPGFRALHLIHSSRRFRTVGELPVATDADARVLTLHHPVLLESEETLDQVVEAIRKVQQHAAAIRDR